MRKQDLDRYRTRLEERRVELLEQFRSNAGARRETEVQGGEDYVDNAVTNYTREFLLSLTDRDRGELVLVEEALQRIRDGEYGICQMSGDEISKPRLDAIPWARYTRDCQEVAEREALAGPDRDLATTEVDELLEYARASLGKDPDFDAKGDRESDSLLPSEGSDEGSGDDQGDEDES